MRFWLWGLLASLTLTGCEQAPPQLEHDSLLYCIADVPLSFNPQLVRSTETLDATAHQLYDRLLNIEPHSQQLVPALATHWRQSADGLKYQFTLREQVSFHDTPWFVPSRYLTAKDVAFSFNRILDPQHPYHQISGGQYPFFNSINWAKRVKGVRALNERQVEFVLRQPDADFLTNLTTEYAVILSSEYAEQLLAADTPQLLDQQPVGTGPFKLEFYRPDEFIRYQAHSRYWRGAPRLSQLVFDITHTSSKRLAKLLSGECNAMAQPAASQWAVIKQHPELVLTETQHSSNVSVLALNTEHAPFNDIRVRKALSLALNRDDILQAVYFDVGTVASGLLSPTSWAFTPNALLSKPDLERARGLLAQAGVADGFKMTLLLPSSARTYNPDSLKTGQLIQYRLAQLGVKVTLVDLERQVLRERIDTGEQDAVLTGWSADTPSPDNMLRNLLSCQAIAAGTNASRWCHPVFDKQLDLALLTEDHTQRAQYYQRAQTLAYQEMAVIPLIQSQRQLSYHQHITGLALLPYGGVAFYQAYKE